MAWVKLQEIKIKHFLLKNVNRHKKMQYIQRNWMISELNFIRLLKKIIYPGIFVICNSVYFIYFKFNQASLRSERTFQIYNYFLVTDKFLEY